MRTYFFLNFQHNQHVTRSKFETLNILPITCKTANNKIRVVPSHLTSEPHDLSKMQLEYFNMRLNLQDQTVTEDALKDHHEM